MIVALLILAAAGSTGQPSDTKTPVCDRKTDTPAIQKADIKKSVRQGDIILSRPVSTTSLIEKLKKTPLVTKPWEPIEFRLKPCI